MIPHAIPQELEDVVQALSSSTNNKVAQLREDHECVAYLGYNMQLGAWNLKFRKAKITPKKVGQFVTLWKRDGNKKTVPYHVNDNIDFYLILAQQDNNAGLFIFPKNILVEQRILTAESKAGKRGFRVYPAWSTTDNKQAKKAQSWQVKYFVNLIDSEEDIARNINLLFSGHN